MSRVLVGVALGRADRRFRRRGGTALAGGFALADHAAVANAASAPTGRAVVAWRAWLPRSCGCALCSSDWAGVRAQSCSRRAAGEPGADSYSTSTDQVLGCTGRVAPPLAPAPANLSQSVVLSPTAAPAILANQPSPAPANVVPHIRAPVDTPQPTPQVDSNATPSLASLVIPGPAADGLSRATAFSADDSPGRCPPAASVVPDRLGQRAHGCLAGRRTSSQRRSGNICAEWTATFRSDAAPSNMPIQIGWSGRAATGIRTADWYALVTNLNPVTLNYEIGSSAHEIRRQNVR